ncbi:MAG: type II toxin-antitoxin system prevent-host-death family antitoxin [Chloroflexota bacterium]|nr:MAG: type II toxin-antitoxin system prevent-host-death family antitoxin [Chloroflexota bacterium]
MLTVGIRELKQQASELVRRVRETGNEVQITYHGKVVAMLVPVDPSEPPESEARAWADLDLLAAQIGQRWPDGVSASQAVDEGRR